MPRPTPGDRSGRLGTTVPKRDAVPNHPGPLEPSVDLADRLCRIAGVDVSELVASDAQIERWNATIGTAAHDGFEHRLLVGIAIQQQRPEHGGKRQNDVAIGKQLDQSTRWVRETLRVAGAVSEAIAEGIAIPLDIRDISWRSVPVAIENIRHGRAFDFTPKKEKVDPTPEELHQAFLEALQALTKTLEAFQSPTQRTTLATDAIAALQPYTEKPESEGDEAASDVGDGGYFVPSTSPTDGEPPGAFEPEPEPRGHSQPRRPGRKRPGRGPRRRR